MIVIYVWRVEKESSRKAPFAWAETRLPSSTA